MKFLLHRMRPWPGAVMIVAALASSAAARPEAPPQGELRIVQAWTRATPPGAPVAAGYLEIHNGGRGADRLTGAATTAAQRVELHVVVREGDVVGMREVKSLEVPPGQSLRLQPGGAHLMIVAPRKPFKPGERVPLTLRFERAGEVAVELDVRAHGAHGSHHQKP